MSDERKAIKKMRNWSGNSIKIRLIKKTLINWIIGGSNESTTRNNNQRKNKKKKDEKLMYEIRSELRWFVWERNNKIKSLFIRSCTFHFYSNLFLRSSLTHILMNHGTAFSYTKEKNKPSLIIIWWTIPKPIWDSKLKI